MKNALILMVVAAVLAAAPAAAQKETDLLRFEWVSGLYMQGTMAEAAFAFDTTPFGGPLINRDEGTLDVDPTFTYGIRTHYRLSERWSVNGSWMRAQAAYRVEFPALSSDEGNFDLEGLILGTFDFQADQNGRLSSATSDAHVDMYLASVRYEIPAAGGWMYPYVTAGTGLYQQKSDDNVFRSDFEVDPPPAFETLFATGGDPMQIIGVSRFAIDATDWLVSVGTGMRASLSDRWGVDLGVDDLIQLGADFSHIDASSTPPTDPTNNRLFSTTFVGKTGTIHNFSIRLAMNYSFWPSGRPR